MTETSTPETTAANTTVAVDASSEKNVAKSHTGALHCLLSWIETEAKTISVDISNEIAAIKAKL